MSEQAQPVVDPNARYAPRQLAEMFPSVTVEMLRHWENTGKITPAIKTLGKHRRFTETHVEEIAKFMGQPRRQQS